jgi:hypothetical protein
MSHITGQGFGDDHDWESGYTGPSRSTPYRCKACGETFHHHYPSTPSIFKAMVESGRVSEHCSARAKEVAK